MVNMLYWIYQLVLGEHNMRKIAATFAVLGSLLVATAAQADGYYYHHHNHYYNGGGGGGALIGGLIGGMIIGGMLAQPRYEQPRYYEEEVPVCHREFRGYDYYGRPVYIKVCE